MDTDTEASTCKETDLRLKAAILNLLIQKLSLLTTQKALISQMLHVVLFDDLFLTENTFTAFSFIHFN